MIGIDFGDSLFPTDNTGTDDATTTIVNIANSPINTRISGTDLDGVYYSYVIGVNNIKWATTTFDYELEQDYLKTSEYPVDLDAPRPTTSTGEVSDDIYWGIGIPFDAEADRYYGQNNFIVYIDENDW